MKLNATDVIAGYAAVVGTAALGWEVWKARQARRPQVEVQVRQALANFLPSGTDWIAQIEVRNRGDLPLRVTSAGFEVQDGSDGRVAIIQQPLGATLPGVVSPRDSGMTYLPMDDLPKSGLDPYRPLVAWASLSTGERFRSEAVRFRRP